MESGGCCLDEGAGRGLAGGSNLTKCPEFQAGPRREGLGTGPVGLLRLRCCGGAGTGQGGPLAPSPMGTVSQEQ